MDLCFNLVSVRERGNYALAIVDIRAIGLYQPHERIRAAAGERIRAAARGLWISEQSWVKLKMVIVANVRQCELEFSRYIQFLFIVYF